MRMRKKKNADARLAVCERFILSEECLPMSDPSSVIGKPDSPVYLEIGAGKGGFACGMTKMHPEVSYFAMEKVTDCVVIAAEKAKATEAERGDNLRFIIDTADNLTRIFAPRTVDKIFLNFSDPWPKKGYAKRRLTHRRYLSVYFNLLKDGGTLTFKTDNVSLFDFSLEEFSAMGLSLDVVTRDLHSSEYSRDNVMTEYEKRFSEAGYKINMLRVTKPDGFMPEIPENLRADRKSYIGKEE